LQEDLKKQLEENLTLKMILFGYGEKNLKSIIKNLNLNMEYLLKNKGVISS